jgi:hypothetical protein
MVKPVPATFSFYLQLPACLFSEVEALNFSRDAFPCSLPRNSNFTSVIDDSITRNSIAQSQTFPVMASVISLLRREVAYVKSVPMLVSLKW